jgi:hypothetical protein
LKLATIVRVRILLNNLNIIEQFEISKDSACKNIIEQFEISKDSACKNIIEQFEYY